MDYLEKITMAKVMDDPLLKDAVLHRLDDRLVISLPADEMFAQGSAEFNEGAEYALSTLGDNFNVIGNRIDVVGVAC